jgi:DNA modification methylase
MLNQIINGDCFEVMPQIPANSIDLIIFDPPYNIGSDAKITFVDGKPKTTNEAWGEEGYNDTFSEIDYKTIIEKSTVEFNHILKEDGSVIIFYDRGYGEYLVPLKQVFTLRNTFFFLKENPSPHMRKNNYRSGFESAMWLSRKKYKLNFLSQGEMINVFKGNNSGKETEHPTEKYRWMIEPLIKAHSNVGDTVLDPMCGSGTTCVLAKELGRNYIGIEIEKKYYEIAQNRVNKSIINPQPDLDNEFK